MNSPTPLANFLFWMQMTPTIVSVTLPALLFPLGLLLVPAWRAKVVPLMLMSMATAPVSVVCSFWGDGGLHILPTYAVPMLALAITGRIDMRVHWFAVLLGAWVGLVVPDVYGSWAHDVAPSVWKLETPFYFGVGGYGLLDGLVVDPVLIAGLLALVQAADRGGWMQKMARRVPAVQGTGPCLTQP